MSSDTAFLQPSLAQYNGQMWELCHHFTHDFAKGSFDKDILRSRNFFAVLGRRVSCHIGQKSLGDQKVQNLFPKEVQLMGQVIEASLLERFHNIYTLSSSVDYFTNVFAILSTEGSVDVKVRTLAAPNGVPPKALPYGVPNSEELILAKSLVSKAFQLQVVIVDDSITGSELIAVGYDPLKAQLLQALEKADAFHNPSLAVDSHKLLNSNIQLRWDTGSGCKILEGSEIQEWMDSQSKSSITRKYIYSQLTERLNKYQLSVQNIALRDFTICFVQELSDKVASIRVPLNSTVLNEIRQQICPGIKVKKFGEIEIAEVRCNPLNPITFDSDDFHTYIRFFQAKLKKPALDELVKMIKV